jgi:hypothetical protein
MLVILVTLVKLVTLIVLVALVTLVKAAAVGFYHATRQTLMCCWL